ncbi:protein Spindly [Drosophila sulfurigaster albostrigata]|uniref:protein Spindly n=1 Tax=Drosophila sulfurigaster albostrigata TaxID=89887 RepID=UPI002D21A02B|nr:protein Spindly [Drosophila sulfurigaster albostrigata]
MYKNLDLSALSVDDIIEEYKLLHGRHEQLKERCDADAQRIHELKRSLDTSLAAEKYLTQELEQYNQQAQVVCPDNELRLQQELDELRRKYRNLQLEHETLQQDHDAKTEETECLKSKLEATVRDLESSTALKANSADDEIVNRLTAMEQENAELIQKLAEYEDVKVQNTFAVAEQEKTIEILKDQLSCMEENLRGKRDELEEKLQLLESSQEQLVEANAKIAMLSSAPEQNDRKGNSLFAEVDDQRQAMKHLLASQKKSYLDMKKIFNDSKYEIHRLKRENIAMHTELQACSTIFCSADKTYQNKLNERIRQLMAQNVKLERNLNVSQERLRDLASQKSVTWLDSMLEFCKRETDDLKTQLHSMHIQKATIEEQLRNVQQEMVRWRFESLKSRCVLIDRENLLTEHKIAFKQVKAMEFDIKEAELKAALPRIVSALPTATSSPLIATAATEVISLVTPLKTPLSTPTEVINLDTPLKIEPQEATPITPKEVKQELSLNEDQATIVEQEIQCKMEPAESTAVEQLPIVSKSRLGLIKVKADCELMSEEQTAELLVAAKPNRKGTPIKFAQIKTELSEDEEPLNSPAKPNRKGTPVKIKGDVQIEGKPLRKTTPGSMKISSAEKSPIQEVTNSNVRSIMSKKRDLFAEDNQKNVEFSSSEPIVHNLSPDVCSPVESRKENEQPGGKDIKPLKKSQNIIRRIVVAPRNSGLSLK